MQQSAHGLTDHTPVATSTNPTPQGVDLAVDADLVALRISNYCWSALLGHGNQRRDGSATGISETAANGGCRL